MVLMRVRHQDSLHFVVGDCFEIRQCTIPGILRVHPAIKQKPVSVNLEIVRIRTDLCVPCEICEFQCDSADVSTISYQSWYCLNSRFRVQSNNWSPWKEKRIGSATQARIWSRISASIFLLSPPPWSAFV